MQRNVKFDIHPAVFSVVLVALACAFGPAAQAQYSFAVESGLGYADNVARLPEGQEVAETLGLIRVLADLEHQGPRLQAVVRSDVQYADYLRHKFEAERLGGVDVVASYDLVPDYLAWTVSENYGQQVTDPFRAVGPGNRQNISYLTTGPVVTVPFARTNFFSLTGRYSDVRYEETPLDNERAGGDFLLGHNLSTVRWLALGYSKDKVTYDNVSLNQSDFDTERWYIRMNSQTGHSTLELDVGKSILNLPTGQESEPLFISTLSWNITDARELRFELGQRFADAGEAFRRLQGTSIDVGRSQDILGTGAPFKNRYAGIGADFTAPRGTLRSGVSWATEDYPDAPTQNRRTASFEIDFLRQLSRFWSFIADARVDKRDFVDLDRRDTDRFVQIGAIRTLGRRFAAVGRLQGYRRTTSAVNENVTDRMILLTFRYSPRGAISALNTVF